MMISAPLTSYETIIHTQAARDNLQGIDIICVDEEVLTTWNILYCCSPQRMAG